MRSVRVRHVHRFRGRPSHTHPLWSGPWIDRFSGRLRRSVLLTGLLNHVLINHVRPARRIRIETSETDRVRRFLVRSLRGGQSIRPDCRRVAGIFAPVKVRGKAPKKLASARRARRGRS